LLDASEFEVKEGKHTRRPGKGALRLGKYGRPRGGVFTETGKKPHSKEGHGGKPREVAREETETPKQLPKSGREIT
jgi:hypothetical protein